MITRLSSRSAHRLPVARTSTHLFFRAARSCLWVGASLLLASGCKKSPPADGDTSDVVVVEGENEEKAEPADPPEPTWKGQKRCALPADAAAFTLRSDRKAKSDEEESELLRFELGQGVALTAGFAVGVIEPGGVSQARVAFVDDRGAGSVVDAGAVHGDVNPPRLARFGNGVVGLVEDSDASGRVYRLFRIADAATKQVEKGPDFSDGRDESATVALAVASNGKGLIVWDREEKSRATSELVRVTFDPQTLRAGKIERLSAAGRDEEAPLLVARPGGFYLVTQSFEKLGREVGAGQADGLGVVEEPPAHLFAQPLDEDGRPSGARVELIAGAHQVAGIDAARDVDDSLLVAVRLSDSSEESRHLRLVRLRPDGSKSERVFDSDELGTSIPLFVEIEGSAPWLLAREASGAFWASIVPSGDGQLVLEPEFELARREPLAASPTSWLVFEPRGRDVDLKRLICKPNSAAPAAPPSASRP